MTLKTDAGEMRHFRHSVKTGDCGRLRDAVSSPLLAVGSGFALARELKRCIDFCRRNSLLAGVEPIWGYLPVSSPRMRGLPRQALAMARELKRNRRRTRQREAAGAWHHAQHGAGLLHIQAAGASSSHW